MPVWALLVLFIRAMPTARAFPRVRYSLRPLDKWQSHFLSNPYRKKPVCYLHSSIVLLHGTNEESR